MVSYLTLILSNICLCCTDDCQTQDPTPSIVQNAVLLLVSQLSAIFQPPAKPKDRCVFHTQCTNKTHFNNCCYFCYELPYLTRGKRVISVEQVNCISSPSMRQALSNRHTNLGGAGKKGKKKKE